MTSSKDHVISRACDCVICYQDYLKPIIKGNNYREYPLYDGHPGCMTEDGTKCLMLRKDYNAEEKLAFTTCPCSCHYRIRLGLEPEAPSLRDFHRDKNNTQDSDSPAKRQGDDKDCVCTTRGLCECGAEGPE